MDCLMTKTIKSDPVIYLSGPMTGYPEFNFPAFRTEANRLRREGYRVVNPAEHGQQLGLSWADYLRKDIELLMKCDRIHLLPGWANSKGARLEHHIAIELGLEVTGAAA